MSLFVLYRLPVSHYQPQMLIIPRHWSLGVNIGKKLSVLVSAKSITSCDRELTLFELVLCMHDICTLRICIFGHFLTYPDNDKLCLVVGHYILSPIVNIAWLCIIDYCKQPIWNTYVDLNHINS